VEKEKPFDARHVDGHVARILLFHYREAKRGKAILEQLKLAGHRVIDAAPDYPEFKPCVDLASPEVIVVDGTKQPSHGIEAAGYVAGLAKYRGARLILTNFPDSLVPLVRQKLPQAIVVGEADVVKAVG
jgi:AmiR/NasT family two-component response regulator